MLSWQTAVERTVTGLGYDLVDTERTAGGLLRVYLDRVAGDPAGEFITVDDCEKVTRQLQHVLEVEGCAYERLEVSSPGLDRPLKRAADYSRFAGNEIDLTLKAPFNGRKKYRGVLHAQGEGWRVVLSGGDNDGSTDQALDFSLSEVREARLVPVVDFKGRRFSEPESAATEVGGTQSQGSGDEVDGGRIQ
jgi:ribosome maturation factor RimP